MRNKYIRFFISSTFADMVKERNLLQQVLDDLANEYSQQGWQIESVDLRWGISEEAGLDNKTMQICLGELKRCQELSPKPNFIILYGDRYGWIPLPECISISEWRSLTMTADEQKLFDDWYKLNDNVLPEGNYELQGRHGRYVKEEYWRNEVERPLGKMLRRNHATFFGKSAIELEIEEGALKVDNAYEHVVAYIRHLTNVPSNVLDFFRESRQTVHSQWECLRNKIIENTSDDNKIEKTIRYDEYQSETYAEQFKEEMRKRLLKVINSTVRQESNSKLEKEASQHSAYATEESAKFVGRNDVLNKIHQYIDGPSQHKALWICSPSGLGKSALLSKVVETYSRTHNVVSVFCGLTVSSSDAVPLLRFIWNEIKRYDTSKSYNILNRYTSLCEMVAGKLRHYTNSRPLLLVIDAINQVDDSTDAIARLEWLNGQLADNVRVVFSSTNELRYNIERQNVIRMELPNMGSDSWLLVENILFRHNRQITDAQKVKVRQAIELSDKSAIYLYILGHWLVTIPSWEENFKVPLTLEAVVRQLLDDLAKPSRHGKMLLCKIISCLCADRMGLSQEEILDLLSEDETFVRYLRDSSFHIIPNEHRVPPVIWSRLYYDLMPFLRNRYTSEGQLLCIFHNQLRDVLRHIFLGSKKMEAETASALFLYYISKIPNSNPHALGEVIYQGHICQSLSSLEERQDILAKIKEMLTCDMTFICEKLHWSPQKLMDDYDLVSDDYEKTISDQFMLMKKELTDVLHLFPNVQQMALYFKALPNNRLLRQTAEKAGLPQAMNNRMADVVQPDTMIHMIKTVGENPKMSEDGNLIASLFSNRHEVRICDLITSKVIKSYTIQSEISDIAFDDKLRYNVIRTKKEVLLYDNVGRKIIVNIDMLPSEWFSLSADGQRFIVGKNEEVRIYNLDGSYNYYQVPTKSGMVSPTGRYLWAIDNQGWLIRHDIDTDAHLNMIRINKNGSLPDIVACSEEWCAYGDTTLVRHYIESNGKDSFYLIEHKPANLVRFAEDEMSVFINQHNMCMQMMLTEMNDNSCIQEVMERTHIFNLSQVNRTQTRAFIVDKPVARVVDLSLQMKNYSTSGFQNSGVNTMASSYDGREIVVSTGINPLQDTQPEVLRISQGHMCSWCPPFVNNSHSYVSTSAISPKGDRIAVASLNGENCEIMLLSEHHQVLARQSTGHNVCIAITFSSDGRYLLAQTGSYFDETDCTLYLMDYEGKLLMVQQMDIDKWPNKNHLYMTSDNRYAISSGAWQGVGVYDIVGSRMLFTDEDFYVFNAYPVNYHLMLKSFCCPVILPFENLILCNDKKGCLCILHPETEMTERTNLMVKPVACSASGQELFMIDGEKGDLYMYSWPLTEHRVLLSENVLWVVPALDENHIYIVLTDNTIVLYDFCQRKKIQCGFWGTSLYMKACAGGLLVCNDLCEVAMLTSESLTNERLVTNYVKRWNLTTGNQDYLEAICPACGGHIGMNERLGKMHSTPYVRTSCEVRNSNDLNGDLCPHCGVRLKINHYV